MFKLLSKITKWSLMLLGTILFLSFFVVSIVFIADKANVLLFLNELIGQTVVIPPIEPPIIPEVPVVVLGDVMFGSFNFTNSVRGLIYFITHHSDIFLFSMTIMFAIIYVLGPIAYRINYKKDIRKIKSLLGRSNSAMGKLRRSSKL